MFDVVDAETGEVLKQGALSRAAAIDWINQNLKLHSWSMKGEEGQDECYPGVIFISTSSTSARRLLRSAG